MSHDVAQDCRPIAKDIRALREVLCTASVAPGVTLIEADDEYLRRAICLCRTKARQLGPVSEHYRDKLLSCHLDTITQIASLPPPDTCAPGDVPIVLSRTLLIENHVRLMHEAADMFEAELQSRTINE